ncbi:MAG: hypothetical protein AB7O69_17515, partial [Burkholderiales bacterium]
AGQKTQHEIPLFPASRLDRCRTGFMTLILSAASRSANRCRERFRACNRRYNRGPAQNTAAPK